MRGLDIWSMDREAAEVIGNVRVLRGGDDSLPTVRIWVGKAKKPRDNYHFKDVESRERFIAVKVPQYNESIRKRAEAVKRARAERAGNERLLNAVFEGAIFHHSWGYEQTNCDYYQVVARKGRTVHLREIAGRTIEGSEGYMSDTRKPVKDHFTSDKILKKRLQFTGDGRPYISFEFGWCDLWDGTANYCSWYA